MIGGELLLAAVIAWESTVKLLVLLFLLSLLLVDVDMAVFVLVVDALVMDMRKLGKSDGQLQRGNRSCLQCDCPRMGWKTALACNAIALGWLLVVVDVVVVVVWSLFLSGGGGGWCFMVAVGAWSSLVVDGIVDAL